MILVMGMDAFCTLSEWRQPERILELANLWVAQRNDTLPEPASTESAWLRQYRVDSPEQLKAGATQVFVAKTASWSCSSSQVRDDINAEKDIIDVPDVVLDYIKEHQLYRAISPNRSQ
jgi:nicotinic acid mononucleotide adenylyltransferase